MTKVMLLGALATTLVFADASAQKASQPPRDPVEYARHVELAKIAAKPLAPAIADAALILCNYPGIGRDGDEYSGAAPPGKAFDNLYYVGMKGVSAWAVKTSAGLILIDSLNSSSDAANILVPGLQKFGLDPAQIKYVVITHQHGDHFGGAKYLAETYGARVIASDADWKGMEAIKPDPARPRPAPPTRDITVEDGYKLMLGDTTLSLYITPGHTPGTISLLIPVTDEGKPHMAYLWGGSALSNAQLKEYSDSALRLRLIAIAAKADIYLSNHPYKDESLVYLSKLAARKPGEPNPFIKTPGSAPEVLSVLSECAKSREAARPEK